MGLYSGSRVLKERLKGEYNVGQNKDTDFIAERLFVFVSTF